jgi:hypothetical protein
MARRHRSRRDPDPEHHQRPPDPQEATDQPLVPKARPEHEGEDATPHSALNNPVGEPDPDADTDPYDPDADAADPPPPGRFKGPGPEPDEPDSGGG